MLHLVGVVLRYKNLFLVLIAVLLLKCGEMLCLRFIRDLKQYLSLTVVMLLKSNIAKQQDFLPVKLVPKNQLAGTERIIFLRNVLNT